MGLLFKTTCNEYETSLYGILAKMEFAQAWNSSSYSFSSSFLEQTGPGIAVISQSKVKAFTCSDLISLNDKNKTLNTSNTGKNYILFVHFQSSWTSFYPQPSSHHPVVPPPPATWSTIVPPSSEGDLMEQHGWNTATPPQTCNDHL